MKTSRRAFLQTSALASFAVAERIMPASSDAEETNGPELKGNLNAFVIAKEHAIKRDIVGPSFFEGMLLGNGDVGACVVVRQDALGIHIGKNDCWDIRADEKSAEQALPLSELLDLWRRASEEAKKQGKPGMIFLEDHIDFFREYSQKTQSSYRQKWPRPWPCGTIWINWDLRRVRPLQYQLDPSNGMFTLDLACSPAEESPDTVKLSAFVDWSSGMTSVVTDKSIELFSVVLAPEMDQGPVKHTAELLLPPDCKVHVEDSYSMLSCFQHFPAMVPTGEQPPSKSDLNRNFSLLAKIMGKWSIGTGDAAVDSSILPAGFKPILPAGAISLKPASRQALNLAIFVATPRDVLISKLEKQAKVQGHRDPVLSIPQTHIYSADELDTMHYAREQVEQLTRIGTTQLQRESESQWCEFWSSSAVKLSNKELERIWYHNQYFLACCLKKNKVAPGLFANWSTGNIGTAWHGDYHMDYNYQQIYWGVFSSNHPDMHHPNIELCENLRAMSEKFARDKFNLPGAYFPHSAYPVPSQAFPYPSPDWGLQISETPWTVQSLWWHYLYTQDEEVLRRVYPLLRSAARFVSGYVQKGPDHKYHVIPTVSSENWGCTVDFRLNKDCILDLALIEFLLDAVVAASAILGTDVEERTRWSEVRGNLAPYPTGKIADGEVWLDVTDAPVEYVYNIPITLAPVFPGEQVGLESGSSLDIARRTAQIMRLEGADDLVYQPFILARLGILDLDWFIREVRYCMLPNGTASDRLRQSGGRFSQSSDFDAVLHAGIWIENFALPAVLNECMLQSYSGTIHLFPNTQNLGPAHFEDLRAVGAFLVSAAYDGKYVTDVTLLSEKGKDARIASPWGGKAMKIVRMRDGLQKIVQAKEGVHFFQTKSGERYLLSQA